MNEFVNFQKRGIELPPGCKDLIDVLPPPREARVPVEGLSHIERYLSRLLQLPPKLRSVWIDSYPPVTPVTLGLIHTTKRKLCAVIFIAAEPEKSSIRSVLVAAGIPATQDEALTEGGGLYAHVITCLLPVDAAIAARLVSELLQKGYGLSADVELEFRYRVKANQP
jgi:hypothetical protein